MVMMPGSLIGFTMVARPSLDDLLGRRSKSRNPAAPVFKWIGIVLASDGGSGINEKLDIIVSVGPHAELLRLVPRDNMMLAGDTWYFPPP